MGQSKKEDRADTLWNNSERIANERWTGLGALLENQRDSSLAALRSGEDEALGFLANGENNINLTASSRASGIGAQLSEALKSRGVAGGSDQSGAWVTQMAPIYASSMTELGNLSKARAGIAEQSGITSANIWENFGSKASSSFLDLMRTGDQGRVAGMGGSKDSTMAGDIFGGLGQVAMFGLSLFKLFPELFSSSSTGGSTGNSNPGSFGSSGPGE